MPKMSGEETSIWIGRSAGSAVGCLRLRELWKEVEEVRGFSSVGVAWSLLDDELESDLDMADIEVMGKDAWIVEWCSIIANLFTALRLLAGLGLDVICF